jgi:hypothetical protein
MVSGVLSETGANRPPPPSTAYNYYVCGESAQSQRQHSSGL